MQAPNPYDTSAAFKECFTCHHIFNDKEVKNFTLYPKQAYCDDCWKLLRAKEVIAQHEVTKK